jgi:hypothetical protein
VTAAAKHQAFERALGWYPTGWRERHGAEALGVLLDQADADGRAIPTRGERLDLAWHGTLEHLRSVRGWVPASVRDRAAAVSLGAGATFAVMMFLLVEWNPKASQAYAEMIFGSDIGWFGPFASPAVALYAVWFAALVLALLGAPRAARVTVALTIPVAVVVRQVGDAGEMWMRPSWTTLGVLMLLAAVAALGRVGGDRRSAAWVAISAVGMLAFCAIPLALRPDTVIIRDPIFLEWPMEGVLYWILVGVVPFALLLRLAGSRAWSGAVLLAALPWLAAILASTQGTAQLVALMTSAALAVAALVIVVGALRVFGVRVRVERVERAPRT